MLSTIVLYTLHVIAAASKQSDRLIQACSILSQVTLSM